MPAIHEYGPFGEVVRATGPMAKANPFRFSTRFQDDESDLVMYPRRCYNPSTGRWLSHDPAEEFGGINLYAMVNNASIIFYDPLGLWGTDQHHALIDTWLTENPPPDGRQWSHYKWHCIYLNVRALLKQGERYSRRGRRWLG